MVTWLLLVATSFSSLLSPLEVVVPSQMGHPQSPAAPSAAERPLGRIRDVNNGDRLLAALNSYREQNGLPTLTLNSTATVTARMQARYNVMHRTHGHYNAEYPESKDQLKAAGHHYQPCLYYTEYNREVCVRLQKFTPRFLPVLDSMVLRAYQESPLHNEALLDPTVRRVGIATVWDGWELQNTMVLCI
jgi:uncharacterized protein YkwD